MLVRLGGGVNMVGIPTRLTEAPSANSSSSALRTDTCRMHLSEVKTPASKASRFMQSTVAGRDLGPGHDRNKKLKPDSLLFPLLIVSPPRRLLRMNGSGRSAILDHS
ncbi:hypothetical protein C7T36_14720 [Rhodococcus sp. AD45-ID]|nr:hypothetical protein SZ00_02022 [Rhodococcus sp. AD45]PSR43296.1 hypothetical protein C7T36_14720 [Rhodococcus sp. AD45-ID]